MIKITASKTIGCDAQQIRYELSSEFQHPCYAMRSVLTSIEGMPSQEEIERKEKQEWLALMLDALEKHAA